MTLIESLTSRQQEVFQTLREFIRKHGYPPTMRDLAKKLRIVNASSINRMLDVLEDKGLLETIPGKSRAIKLSDASPVFSESEEVLFLPVAGRIIAGSPEEAIENIEDKRFVPSYLAGNNPKAFLLNVKGDSMEPELHEGDVVVISPQPTAHSGELVAAMIEGEATVKQFVSKGKQMVLHPFNSDYPDIPVKHNFKIIGKVTGLLRRL